GAEFSNRIWWRLSLEGFSQVVTVQCCIEVQHFPTRRLPNLLTLGTEMRIFSRHLVEARRFPKPAPFSIKDIELSSLGVILYKTGVAPRLL
ncbi:hypothetical protein Tco_0921363, partial [Tanacetum coccineum]